MAKELTDEHVALLKMMFTEFDQDLDDKLDASDFARAVRTVCVSIGQPITENGSKAIAQEYSDGTGLFGFDKFIAVITAKMVQAYTTVEMRKIYRGMDRDAKGFITVDEMRQNFGDRLTEDEIQEAFQNCTDGKFKFDDFYKLMNPFKN
ncbi:calmodulin-like [Teleopsis dalmanni]|uniref:calmodulin-like n=1 Tax=Teleopsis dalmanni TaxID=139649 RepID=UPI0018CF461A|nr:calmodulin-like [Teleopsis dalmanni]